MCPTVLFRTHTRNSLRSVTGSQFIILHHLRKNKTLQCAKSASKERERDPFSRHGPPCTLFFYFYLLLFFVSVYVRTCQCVHVRSTTNINPLLWRVGESECGKPLQCIIITVGVRVVVSRLPRLLYLCACLGLHLP